MCEKIAVYIKGEPYGDEKSAGRIEVIPSSQYSGTHKTDCTCSEYRSIHASYRRETAIVAATTPGSGFGYELFAVNRVDDACALLDGRTSIVDVFSGLKTVSLNVHAIYKIDFSKCLYRYPFGGTYRALRSACFASKVVADNDDRRLAYWRADTERWPNAVTPRIIDIYADQFVAELQNAPDLVFGGDDQLWAIDNSEIKRVDSRTWRSERVQTINDSGKMLAYVRTGAYSHILEYSYFSNYNAHDDNSFLHAMLDLRNMQSTTVTRSGLCSKCSLYL